ncbi:hypothetical protein HYH03_014627 [Edaphochlamys debaryana]|uniref:Uncharacterized protein n=1 Tax=Edaphochlamys debaryana TaxID=47281 RepID=A0A835XPQ0_9CHLO|nr:hypothetical protein HYH03_014627 [Edaphochlamys debaryana]|eukprot:KAG2486698.1 hypothetical protein HYH03_014627 [Edaphochlamys debaryana]
MPGLATHMSAPGALRDLSLEQRRQIVCLAAASGDVASLERMLAVAGVAPSPLEIGTAAAAGELDACRWLLERGCPLDHPYRTDRSALEIAAAAGSRVGCEWLLAHGAKVSGSELWAAGGAGHAELLEWLYEQLPAGMKTAEACTAIAYDMVAGVAAGCDLPTLQRWWRRLQEGSALDTGSKGYILASAAASPTPDWREKVDWLAAEGLRVTSSAGRYAAARPDGVPRLEWLLEAHGCQPSEVCLHYVLRGKNETVDTVRWLLRRLPPPAERVWVDMRAAAGNVAKLRLLAGAGYLAGQPRRDPMSLLPNALRSGSREASAWLLEEARRQGQDLTLTADLFAHAAASGDVSVMAWLRELGCPCDESSWDECVCTMSYRLGAAATGCEAALEFLAEQRFAMPADGSPYVAAAGKGDIHTLEVLRRLGMPFGPPDGCAFADAISGRDWFSAPLPALRWLWRAARAAAGEPQLTSEEEEADTEVEDSDEDWEQEEGEGEEEEDGEGSESGDWDGDSPSGSRTGTRSHQMAGRGGGGMGDAAGSGGDGGGMGGGGGPSEFLQLLAQIQGEDGHVPAESLVCPQQPPMPPPDRHQLILPPPPPLFVHHPPGLDPHPQPLGAPSAAMAGSIATEDCGAFTEGPQLEAALAAAAQAAAGGNAGPSASSAGAGHPFHRSALAGPWTASNTTLADPGAATGFLGAGGLEPGPPGPGPGPAATASSGPLVRRRGQYENLHRLLAHHVRSGTAACRTWPARRQDEVDHQVVFAAFGIKSSGLTGLGGPSGGTIHKVAADEVPTSAGGGGGGSGAGGGGGGGGSAPQPPPRVGAGGMLIEVKGFLGSGNAEWPRDCRVSRFFLAAPGELSEAQAAEMLPEPARVVPATYKLSGTEVWYAPKVSLVVVDRGDEPAAAGPGGAAAGGGGGGRPKRAPATARDGGGAGSEAGSAGRGAAETGDEGGGGSAAAAAEAPPTAEEMCSRQWQLAAAQNFVYLFLEAVVMGNLQAMEALLPRLPRREGLPTPPPSPSAGSPGPGPGAADPNPGWSVQWDRVHADRFTPLHLAVTVHKLWPPPPTAADDASGPNIRPDGPRNRASYYGWYTVPYMPMSVRLRVVRWLLERSTAPPPAAPLAPPPSPSQGRGRGRAARGGGGSGGSAAGAAAAGTSSPPPPVRRHSELVMARTNDRTVPLMTALRYADGDGEDWRELVGELLERMSWEDYCQADSKKGWYPHHVVSSLGSRPPPSLRTGAGGGGGGGPGAPAPSSTGPSGSGSAAADLGPQPLPGSEGCMGVLLDWLTARAAEKLREEEAARQAAATGTSPGGRKPPKKHKGAAPAEALPPPEPEPGAVRALVGSLLFHLHSQHYDGRLLEKEATRRGISVAPPQRSHPSGAYAMEELSRALLLAGAEAEGQQAEAGGQGQAQQAAS